MPSANMLVDDTYQTNVTLSSDGSVAQNDDGSWRIDFGGAGGAALFNLDRPIDLTHQIEVKFDTTGNPHNAHATLNQQGFAQASIGSPPNVWGAGSYDNTFTITTAPNGQLRISANAMGDPWSLSGVDIRDLDA